MFIDLIFVPPPILGYVATATILAVEAVAAVASVATAVYSSVEQANTAKQTAKANNAAADAEAANKEALAAEGIRRQREINRRKVSVMRNSLASGGGLLAGTPLDLISESSANMELGIQDAARQSEVAAESLRMQGQMGLWQGDQQASADYLSGASSALKGAGTAAIDFSNYQNEVQKEAATPKTGAT
jgi:hypothetical protein